MKSVYLCGGINGLNDSECKDWREKAKLELAKFKVLDPMARDFRGKEANNANEIVDGDLRDIANSDIVLVKADRASWGTAMEIVYARFLGKKIIAFGVPFTASPWLVYHCDGHLCATLEQALHCIVTDLL